MPAYQPGQPAHLSSQPTDCQHSQAALNHKNTEISTIQNSLLCRTAAACLPHTTTKKILWKPCMWFFFLWNEMEIIWWNDNKKRWLFVKKNMNIANFASVRNSMVPNLNLLSSLTTLVVKNQAQFNEKKISTKCRILKTNFDCKKIIMQQICSEHETQKVVKSNQFFYQISFFQCQDQSGIFGQSLAVF